MSLSEGPSAEGWFDRLTTNGVANADFWKKVLGGPGRDYTELPRRRCPSSQAFLWAMIADGRGYLADACWLAFFPGVAILLVDMALNFFVD